MADDGEISKVPDGDGANAPKTSDFELAQRSANGDMGAFQELYERHNRRVYSLYLRMTGNVV